jgi:hypothetical protein
MEVKREKARIYVFWPFFMVAYCILRSIQFKALYSLFFTSFKAHEIEVAGCGTRSVYTIKSNI